MQRGVVVRFRLEWALRKVSLRAPELMKTPQGGVGCGGGVFVRSECSQTYFPKCTLQPKPNYDSPLHGKFYKRIPINCDRGSFYKDIPWKKKYREILCKIFRILKFEIEFHSQKKVVSPNLENCAHLFILNYMFAKFQQH